MLVIERKIWTPDNSFLLEYHGRAATGEIIIGQELWQELENLVDDLHHNDRYFYDTTAADLRMDFMENCVRLTKSPFYNKPMVLMLWQKAFIETMYSFKMAQESMERNMIIDRFKQILLLIARKNTKSETCSALVNAEFNVGNEGADICCASNDDTQSSIVYDAVDLMRQLYDPKDLDTKRNQRFILNKVTNTKVFKMSSRTNAKEGRNIDFAVVDEIHEMLENLIGKPIEQSQSLKDNPKMILITTEGFVNGGYLDEVLKAFRKVIKREDDGISAERMLPWLYTQDSEQEVWQNRASWVKSNPTLGIVKKWSYLDEQVDKARTSKADRMFVLSKDFNIKQNGAESWLNLQDYEYKAVYDIEDFRGCVCLGAVDLAETTDMSCAKILMMRPNDKTKYIYTHYFIPESKLENSDDKNAGADYQEWARMGLLTITDGNEVDLSMVADWFYKLYKDYNIKLWKCGYDQRFSKDWIARMGVYGWERTGDDNSDLILINQNAQTLSNAMKLVEAELKSRSINYNENVVDRWCFKNAGIQIDKYGMCLCVKQETPKRIDGAVTLIILYEMFRRYRTDFTTMIKGG